jgi:hypothetical protein
LLLILPFDFPLWLVLQIPVSALQELLPVLLRIPLVFVEPFKSPPNGIGNEDSLLATIPTILLQLATECGQIDW